MALNIRKGDEVRVISGPYKGSEGKVLAVHTGTERVTVEGVNTVTKHVRAQPGGDTGGLIHVEAPVHVSNVALMVEVDGEKTTTRVGFRRDEVTKTRPDGSSYTAHRSVRIARKTGEEI